MKRETRQTKTSNPNPSQARASPPWLDPGKQPRRKTGHKGPAALVHGGRSGWPGQPPQAQPRAPHSFFSPPNFQHICPALRVPILGQNHGDKRHPCSLTEGPWGLLIIRAGLSSDITSPGRPRPCPAPALGPPATILRTCRRVSVCVPGRKPAPRGPAPPCTEGLMSACQMQEPHRPPVQRLGPHTSQGSHCHPGMPHCHAESSLGHLSARKV